jgi:hypothetical protein
VLYPSEYGADPTGSEESSDAIMKAVEDAYKLQKGIELVAGVNDLGGVVIDLGGGDYKISKPITFSPGAGNIVVSNISFIIFLICHTFSFCSSEFVYLPMEI